MSECKNEKGIISRIASEDTPQSVKIDGSLMSLIVWLVGRFGILIVVSLVFGMATKQIYEDMREDRYIEIKDRTLLIEAFQENTRAMRSFERVLEIALEELEKK